LYQNHLEQSDLRTLNPQQQTFIMALPVIKTLTECSSLQKMVLPYLPQLYALPQRLLQSWNNPAELQTIYLATNPLITSLAFSLFLAPVFLIVSEINKNYSQVDRCWSILPTIYNAHYCLYAHLNGLETSRLDHLVAFSTVWSVRVLLDTSESANLGFSYD
jgi:hypothetical protein